MPVVTAVLENEIIFKIVYLVVICVAALALQAAAMRGTKHLLANTNVPRGSIFQNLIMVAIWSLALLLVLEPVFGVQPTAFIAALGVTSIALSLGLQSTISNVFSGLSLMVGRVIDVGDWIEVGDYVGIVTDVNWRSTTIRTFLDDDVIIPNSVLSTTMFRKYSDLTARSFVITLDIRPEADLAEVERDIIDSIAQAEGDLLDPELGVSIYHTGYGTFGFKFDVRIGIKDIYDHMDARKRAIDAVSGRPWLASW